MYPLIHSFFHSFIYMFVSLLSYSVFTTPLMSHLRLRLGFVHPLQDVALQQCLPLSSVCCFPNPGGSLLLCYVVLPSSALSSSCSLPSPWLPLCAAFGPPIVLHSCYMIGPFPHVSVCILYQLSLFFSRFLSMVSYLVALDPRFSFSLLFERFSVCLPFVYLETMFGSHRSLLARHNGPLLFF